MEDQQSVCDILIMWRGKKFALAMSPNATLKELGDELQKLTNVKADTMRFIVPQLPNMGSMLLAPFSEEHERLNLQETSIVEGKPIRMMGVSENEVDEILQGEKLNLRIAGFDEEQKRIRQRTSERSHSSLKLPQGPYIFCDFRTLQLPGIELNPPASEALKRMHMLASDPGIIAIMNKHRWRVGIMTEMAPVGYVGISPKCILGFNQNHGEEISLRLRTDDLKGFRKYESIKRTLLHELAHMIYSEHDANFFALNKQLNEEAASLDWTRSTSHTLSGVKHSDHYDDEFDIEEGSMISHKLGGNTMDQFTSARVASVEAAYRRIADAPTNSSIISEDYEEPDHDASGFHTDITEHIDPNQYQEPDPDNQSDCQEKIELDPDDSQRVKTWAFEPSYSGSGGVCELDTNLKNTVVAESEPFPSDEVKTQATNGIDESHSQDFVEKVDTDVSPKDRVIQAEPYPGGSLAQPLEDSRMQINEPDPDEEELRRIQDPVTIVCGRFQKAIEMLRAEVDPAQVIVVLQTLLKIISNVIEHPNETKFRRLRKANPVIQRNVANHKGSVELLVSIGFNEELVSDETGKTESYLVLKRDDPALLWLAKSVVEQNIAC